MQKGVSCRRPVRAQLKTFGTALVCAQFLFFCGLVENGDFCDYVLGYFYLFFDVSDIIYSDIRYSNKIYFDVGEKRYTCHTTR